MTHRLQRTYQPTTGRHEWSCTCRRWRAVTDDEDRAWAMWDRHRTGDDE